MPIKEQKISKVKGVADIIFCIDSSGSMTPCIEGVKDHVSTFISALDTASPNLRIDWQIGFCAQNSLEFKYLDFTTNLTKFITELAKIDTNADEFTPAAIDFCISNFSWRETSNKFIVVFTDEELEGGIICENVEEKFEELLNKIMYNHIKLFFFGPKCKHYSKIQQWPGCVTDYLESGNFSNVDFRTLLSKLGKTVSLSCGNQPNQGTTGDLIFDLQSQGILLTKL